MNAKEAFQKLEDFMVYRDKMIAIVELIRLDLGDVHEEMFQAFLCAIMECYCGEHELDVVEFAKEISESIRRVNSKKEHEE